MEGKFAVYRCKQISLEPDKYGYNLKIKMITKYDKNGKYIKHIKLVKSTVKLLENSFIMPDIPEE